MFKFLAPRNPQNPPEALPLVLPPPPQFNLILAVSFNVQGTLDGASHGACEHRDRKAI